MSSLLVVNGFVSRLPSSRAAYWVIRQTGIILRLIENSCAGTNLKVGVLSLHFFGSTSTIRPCRFGERFRDGQYSLVSFLFAVFPLTVPPPC